MAHSGRGGGLWGGAHGVCRGSSGGNRARRAATHRGWRRQQQRPSDGRAGVSGEKIKARVGARSGGTGKSSTARGDPATATRGRRSGSGLARVGRVAHAGGAFAAKTPAPTPSAREARQGGAGRRGEGTGHTLKKKAVGENTTAWSTAQEGVARQRGTSGRATTSPPPLEGGAPTHISARRSNIPVSQTVGWPPRAPREG